MLHKRKSLTALFALLGIGFVFLAMGITDLKHPDRTAYQCQYLGRGLSIQPMKAESQVLYSGHRKLDDDIALRCGALGQVVINEYLPLPVDEDGKFELFRKVYHYFPTRYNAEIPVVNPTDVQAAELPPAHS